MRLSLILLLAMSLINSTTDAMEGGNYVSIKEAPYVAQVTFKWNESGLLSFCGAAIISEYWIVTAAHCASKIVKKMAVYVRVGSSSTLDKGVLINVTQIIIHGDYDDTAYYNDISLMKTETPIEFSELVQPIPVSRTAPRAGDFVAVMGFGDLHSGVFGTTFQKSNVPVITNEVCRRSYSTVTEDMFCTSIKDVDLCFGDSGSPAVFDGKLVGVASQGCEYTKPNIFTKVSNFHDWIMKHTGIVE